jgi:hypothetical protein
MTDFACTTYIRAAPGRVWRALLEAGAACPPPEDGHRHLGPGAAGPVIGSTL